MATITEFHNLSWTALSFNNDRTAYRPFGLPMVLCEPDRRDALGNPLANSNALAVRVQIEDVPRNTVVAGHDHVGLLHPDKELYRRDLTVTELYDRLIDVAAQVFFTPLGVEITFEDAVKGDVFQYTTNTGIRDTITFIPSANYYDISDIKIETEDLPPDFYYITYQADYYVRKTSRDIQDQLYCIDASTTATASYRFRMNHPGNIMEETVRVTPAVYMSKVNKAEEEMIAFYQPFTDILQDVYDEEALLERVNWVQYVTPEFIPYLAYLLGLDIPFFPKSLDRLRRTMMTNIVRLQQLKGSKRALVDLFELFGFTTFLINLYWSEDGKKLIRPGETLSTSYRDQEIDIVSKVQIEPILAEYDTDGFGELTIPLLYRPTELETNEGVAVLIEDGDVALDAYVVEKGSTAHKQLQDLVEAMNDDPSGYGESVDGNLPSVTGAGLKGYSQIIISGATGEAVDETLVGQQPPFIKRGVSLDRDQNILSMVFNGAILFEEPNVLEAKRSTGLVLFGFATYTRQDYQVPESIVDLRSNRFDLQLLTQAGTQITPDVLEFLVDFLFRIKAFHSLLNVLIYSQEITETYEVTDFCVGGDTDQRYDTDAGRLQVPPAIIPRTPEDGDCNRSPRDLGYKETDIVLRLRKLANLREEHASWKRLDDRAGLTSDGTTKVEPVTDNESRNTCKFNYRGQDRKLITDRVEDSELEYTPGPNANTPSEENRPSLEESPIDEAQSGEFDELGTDASSNSFTGGYGSFVREFTIPISSFCDPDGATDYCYKGRVRDEVLHQTALVYTEPYHNHACRMSMGIGVYYTFPVTTVGEGHLGSIQKEALSLPFDEPLPNRHKNMLGRLLRSYDNPRDYSLHFTNRRYLTSTSQAELLALQKVGVGIEMPIMHFPGSRFATMNKLEVDFRHPTWKAKPWDDDYSTLCGPINRPCADRPSYLNAEMVENTDGDLLLEFDDIHFKILANGLVPDIPTLGDHTPQSGSHIDPSEVIHSVHMNTDASHPAVTLSEVEPCDTASGEGTLQGNGLLAVTIPRFSSAGDCAAGGYLDFCDGYASDLGYFQLEDINLDRDGTRTALFTALGLELDQWIGQDGLFLLISGIREGVGIRLDCGCSIVDCDSETTSGEHIALECNANYYLDPDGDYDYNADEVETVTSMVLESEVGVCSNMLDGSITSLFELL